MRKNGLFVLSILLYWFELSKSAVQSCFQIA